MGGSIWSKIFFREFLLISMGLFVVLALVEINKAHVVLRSPSEFFSISVYYAAFYVLFLAFRVLSWCIRKSFCYLLSHRHRVLKIFGMCRSLYALTRIRSLF